MTGTIREICDVCACIMEPGESVFHCCMKTMCADCVDHHERQHTGALDFDGLHALEPEGT